MSIRFYDFLNSMLIVALYISILIDDIFNNFFRWDNRIVFCILTLVIFRSGLREYINRKKNNLASEDIYDSAHNAKKYSLKMLMYSLLSFIPLSLFLLYSSFLTRLSFYVILVGGLVNLCLGVKTYKRYKILKKSDAYTFKQ